MATVLRPVPTTRKSPLVLRYLLHAHAGLVSPERAAALLKDFASRPKFEVVKANARHQTWDVRRVG